MKARNSRIPVADEKWVCSRAGSEKVSTWVWDWWMKARVKMPDQQEGRAQEGVEEELDGGVGPSLVAPPGDDEVGRHQRQLEEEEEHDQVQGEEAAHHRRFEQEHPGGVGPRIRLVAGVDQRPAGTARPQSITKKMEMPSTPRNQRTPRASPV